MRPPAFCAALRRCARRWNERDSGFARGTTSLRRWWARARAPLPPLTRSSGLSWATRWTGSPAPASATARSGGSSSSRRFLTWGAPSGRAKPPDARRTPVEPGHSSFPGRRGAERLSGGASLAPDHPRHLHHQRELSPLLLLSEEIAVV